MYKAILFDFGGVIYQHPVDVIPEVIARIYNQPLELAIKEYSKYSNDFCTGKISADQIINSLSSTFKNSKQLSEVKNLWIKYYSELAIPNQEVLDLIKKLRKNYKLYLFSNTSEMSNIHNSRTGIYDYFDDVFMSYQLGLRKPDPKIFQRVISSLGIKPAECIFIDDNLKNLETAKQLGITTILFNVLTDSPSKLTKQLEKLQVII